MQTSYLSVNVFSTGNKSLQKRNFNSVEFASVKIQKSKNKTKQEKKIKKEKS